MKIKTQINTNFNLFIEYTLVIFIIALTGFEFFFRDNILIYYLLAPLSLIAFVNNKYNISKRAIIFLLIYGIITTSQCYTFDLPYSLVLTGMLRFLIYILIATILTFNFLTIFINIVFILCVISLNLYFFSALSDSFYQFLVNLSSNITPINFDPLLSSSNPNQSLIIYTVPLVRVFQNNGPFWEPGMFAVYINIAFSMNVIIKRKMWSYINLIFITASITTLSTTSFIATYIIILFYYIYIDRKNKSIILLVILFLSFSFLYNTELIRGKIATNLEEIDRGYSRFGAILVHGIQIKEYPYFGLGLATLIKQEELLGSRMVTPNGLSNIIRFYGIPFSILYFILLFKFSKIISISYSSHKKNYLILFIILLVVAFSQDVTTRHLYYLFVCFPLVSKETFLKNVKLKGLI